MDRVTLLTSLTRGTPCPACAQRRLEFLLRCDLDLGACLYTAHCRACDQSFEIVAGSQPLGDRDVQEAVAPCPRCGSRLRRAALHCTLTTHECVYTLECADCAASVSA